MRLLRSPHDERPILRRTRGDGPFHFRRRRHCCVDGANEGRQARMKPGAETGHLELSPGGAANMDLRTGGRRGLRASQAAAFHQRQQQGAGAVGLGDAGASAGPQHGQTRALDKCQDAAAVRAARGVSAQVCTGERREFPCLVARNFHKRRATRVPVPLTHAVETEIPCRMGKSFSKLHTFHV